MNTDSEEKIIDFLGKEIKVGDRVVIAGCDRNPKLILGTVTDITGCRYRTRFISIKTDGNRNTERAPYQIIKIVEDASNI